MKLYYDPPSDAGDVTIQEHLLWDRKAEGGFPGTLVCSLLGSATSPPFDTLLNVYLFVKSAPTSLYVAAPHVTHIPRFCNYSSYDSSLSQHPLPE